MRFVALAAGFDGTLAREGRYDERCVQALKALAVTGRKLILVTARELRELLEIFPAARVFDCIVAENGAVMYTPATRESAILARAPSELLLQELRRRGVSPLSVGSAIVTTSAACEPEVRDAIDKLNLDYQIATSEHRLIVSPNGVNKASGVKEALRQLGISAHNLVAIGDAQNDLALFQSAEHAVALSNAHPLLKQCANRTTANAHCDGFLELARDLMESDLAYAPPKTRISLAGRGMDEFSIAPYYDSLLLCGRRGQGKTALGNRLFGELQQRGYQCCVIGADLAGQDAPQSAEMNVFGHPHEPPRLSDIMNALEHPSCSVAVNLAAMPAEARQIFAYTLLLQLQALHDRVGRPHSVLVHHADSLLSAAAASGAAARLIEMTMIYTSHEPENVPVEILEGVSTALALGSAARVPERFSGFGTTKQIEVEIPTASGAAVMQPAQIWIRERRAARVDAALQAIAGGAVCEMRGLAPLSTSVDEPDELTSASGY